MTEQIHLDLIDPNPFQPRLAEDAEVIGKLADNIERNGLLQIPSARKVDGRYQLAFGHTRKAAFDLLNKRGDLNRWDTMPLNIAELTDLQMFEAAVSENIQRRDLNAVEVAQAMKRYMQDFKKTSDECGTFFGVNGATVRGKVRLLDLPKDIQKKISTGEITEGAARKLLTLQRIDKDQVKYVADHLKENKFDDPDQVIADTLKDSENSVEMWHSWNSGTPLAGHNLWQIYLPIEKFPTALLPELKAAEVAKSMGLEFTADLRTQIEDYVDTLRRSPDFVLALLETKTRTGKPEDVAMIERIDHLLHPPACGACSFHAKMDGDHYCALKACHARKEQAWKASIEQAACKKLGVSMYDPKADGKDFLIIAERTDWGKKVLTAKEKPDLRLVDKFSYQQSIDGVPPRYSLIVVGETCRTLKSKLDKQNASAREASAKSERNWAQIRRMRVANESAMESFLWNVAAPAFDDVVAGLTAVEFLKAFADCYGNGAPGDNQQEPDKKASKADRAAFYRRVLMYNLLEDSSSTWELSESKKPITALAKHLQGLATTWGVKLPKNWMDVAAEADKGIAVAAETGEDEDEEEE